MDQKFKTSKMISVCYGKVYSATCWDKDCQLKLKLQPKIQNDKKSLKLQIRQRYVSIAQMAMWVRAPQKDQGVVLLLNLKTAFSLILTALSEHILFCYNMVDAED